LVDQVEQLGWEIVIGLIPRAAFFVQGGDHFQGLFLDVPKLPFRVKKNYPRGSTKTLNYLQYVHKPTNGTIQKV